MLLTIPLNLPDVERIPTDYPAVPPEFSELFYYKGKLSRRATRQGALKAIEDLVYDYPIGDSTLGAILAALVTRVTQIPATLRESEFRVDNLGNFQVRYAATLTAEPTTWITLFALESLRGAGGSGGLAITQAMVDRWDAGATSAMLIIDNSITGTTRFSHPLNTISVWPSVLNAQGLPDLSIAVAVAKTPSGVYMPDKIDVTVPKDEFFKGRIRLDVVRTVLQPIVSATF